MPDEIDLRVAWNDISPYYQRRHNIPTDYAHYGPHAPNENDLRLLGDVSGKRILELGCGGGQCSIAFAKQGAIAYGLDLSDAQIEYARGLAEREGVKVDFRQGDAQRLKGYESSSFDYVFSACALSFVPNVGRCFEEAFRVLKPSGSFVFSEIHPFFDCISEEGPARIEFSYFDRGREEWDWTYEDEGFSTPAFAYQRTVSDWFQPLVEAGFYVDKILEPMPVEERADADPWRDSYPLFLAQLVPTTIIFRSVKLEE